MWKQYLAGLVISAGAVYLFLKVVDLGQMSEALSRMHLVYLIPCAILYLAHYVFRALRWRFLMRPVASVGFKPLLSAMLIGFLGNNLLPAHLGEFVRAYVLGRGRGISKSSIMATIVMERVYDGLTVLFLLMLVLLFMDLPDRGVEGSLLTAQGLRTAGWLGLAVFAGLMAGLQLLRWQQERVLGWLSWCLRPLPERITRRALEMASAFAGGLALASRRDLLAVLANSLLTWVFLGLWAWSLFPAFDLDLGIMAGVLLEVVVALALLIPSAPAFLGTFHLAAAFTLGYLGAGTGVAGSYAMVLWLVQFVLTNLLGLYFLWSEGLGWKALSKGGEDEA
ncbi:MAG: flippase-like domain-containing protein [Desulfarculus sp.]|nr:flippase-like domain-containing protein [Desulfarculus sp.]